MRRLWWIFIFAFLILGITNSVCSQEKLIDSLQAVIANDNISLAERSKTQSKLAEIYSHQDLQRAQKENREALQKAHHAKDINALIFFWGNQLVIENLSKNQEGIQQALDSMGYYFPHVSTFFKGFAKYRIGYMQNIQNDYDQAIASFHKALDYFDEASKQKRTEISLYRAGIYYQLYGIYAEREDDQNTYMYADCSLKNALQSGDWSTILATWQIKGTEYLNRYSKFQDTVYIDSAVTAFKSAIQVYRQQKDRIKSPGIVALSALYLADTYLNHYSPAYKDSITDQIDLALQVSSAHHNVNMLANTYNFLAQFNRVYNHPAEAKKALLTEKKIVDSISPPNYYLNKSLYRNLADLEENDGHYETALKYYKSYLEAYKNVYDQEENKNIKELEAKYENEKKDKALQLAKQKNAFQKQRNVLYIIVSIALIIGLIALFIAYRLKYKNVKQRVALQMEEAERLKAEQKLMYKEKEQLQKELMTGALQIERKNEVLTDLKEKLKELKHPQSKNGLLKLINNEMKLDVDFEQMKSNLQKVHPQFYDELQKKSPEPLTDLDIKYCTYFYLKLSSKEIATIMNVAPKSVRMAKYRLKKKLKLDKDKNVETFLEEILC